VQHGEGFSVALLHQALHAGVCDWGKGSNTEGGFELMCLLLPFPGFCLPRVVSAATR
jgi:hypothetical protein